MKYPKEEILNALKVIQNTCKEQDHGGNRIYINRYFKEVPNGWKEIDLAEFNSRCVGELEDGEDL